MKARFASRVVAAALGLSILTGCSATNSIGTAGTAFEWSAAKQLRVGMTEQETVALIGKPRSVVTRPDGELVWIWVYANGFTGQNGNLSIAMRDGKIIRLPNMDQFG